jgi:hypothetical protein
MHIQKHKHRCKNKTAIDGIDNKHLGLSRPSSSYPLYGERGGRAHEERERYTKRSSFAISSIQSVGGLQGVEY